MENYSPAQAKVFLRRSAAEIWTPRFAMGANPSDYTMWSKEQDPILVSIRRSGCVGKIYETELYYSQFNGAEIFNICHWNPDGRNPVLRPWMPVVASWDELYAALWRHITPYHWIAYSAGDQACSELKKAVRQYELLQPSLIEASPREVQSAWIVFHEKHCKRMSI